MSLENEFRSMVDRAINGVHPMNIVESQLGPDRVDDFTDDSVRVREFTRIASQYANASPEVGPDWVTAIADQVKHASPEGMQELVAMAQRNRDEYEGVAKIDAGGSYQMWSSILKGLLAIQTDQIPPQSPGMISKPELA